MATLLAPPCNINTVSLLLTKVFACDMNTLIWHELYAWGKIFWVNSLFPPGFQPKTIPPVGTKRCCHVGMLCCGSASTSPPAAVLSKGPQAGSRALLFSLALGKTRLLSLNLRCPYTVSVPTCYWQWRLKTIECHFIQFQEATSNDGSRWRERGEAWLYRMLILSQHLHRDLSRRPGQMQRRLKLCAAQGQQEYHSCEVIFLFPSLCLQDILLNLLYSSF